VAQLKLHSTGTGGLVGSSGLMPGHIRRLFYIYQVGQAVRGGHRHHQAWHALLCVRGSCRVYVQTRQQETTYGLCRPDEWLVLSPADWHLMDQFTPDAILLVLSNEYYDPADYVYDPYYRPTGWCSAGSSPGQSGPTDVLLTHARTPLPNRVGVQPPHPDVALF
jgi:hypothetical protein